MKVRIPSLFVLFNIIIFMAVRVRSACTYLLEGFPYFIGDDSYDC